MAKTNEKTKNANGVNGGGQATTGQRLGTLLKSARDIMRKDKGLSGDVDRIPVLTWIMFLKFLDDMELMRPEEAKISGKKFKAAIEPPYRWRDWAAKEEGITGDELIAFINQEECRRPNGTKGPGLFAYLRGLRGAEGGDRRDVIATAFKGTVNRMINGYLLRDVINKVNGIHFTSSDEIHTLGNFYESMLKEMRDAAGDSGEFYTPRAVVRFVVAVVDPRIGETVLDPACGTGGFLVEAFAHMEKQCKTVQQLRQLQQGGIMGGEAKPLPYLPEGRKKYSKTAPIQFGEFAPVRAWCARREEGPQSWKVSAEDVAARGFNLDLKNPNAKTGLAHADPKDLVASMRGHEAAVMRLLGEIDALVSDVGK